MTSLPPDPYKALGVSKEAQIAEIRTAYRKLVLKCHPDKVQDPALKAQKAEEFQKVQQAYELLNNEKERQRYDDQVRLQELKEQMRAAKAAAPRAAPTYNIRTADPRPSTFKSSSPPTKVYDNYSRSYESSPRSFEERTPPRRESSYSEKPPKPERERERERERRDKEKDRERRKKEKAEDSARRAEKEAKEAKRAEKKAREKAEEKERRRGGDEKKRHTAPYIEGYDDEPSKSEKKRSSKKHEDKRDRSSHREEVPPMAAPPVPPMPQERSYTADKEDFAASYIEAAKKKNNPVYSRTVAPPAPTPPPVPGQASPFSPPPVVEEPEAYRSTKSRRGSSGEKSSYKKSSREVLNDPDIVTVSPSARYAQKSAMAATMGSSPPRLNRQNTAPAEYASRPIPTMARSATYAGGYPEDPRGRGRSRLQPQVEESESDEDYERRHRKHRSKKHRSPEPRSSEYVSKYKVSSDGRATLHSSYSRSLETDPADYAAYHYTAGPTNIHVVESSRPQMPDRDASYSRSSAASSYPKYKVNKAYDYGDIAYSHYPASSYQDEYPAAYA